MKKPNMPMKGKMPMGAKTPAMKGKMPMGAAPKGGMKKKGW